MEPSVHIFFYLHLAIRLFDNIDRDLYRRANCIALMKVIMTGEKSIMIVCLFV